MQTTQIQPTETPTRAVSQPRDPRGDRGLLSALSVAAGRRAAGAARRQRAAGLRAAGGRDRDRPDARPRAGPGAGHAQLLSLLPPGQAQRQVQGVDVPFDQLLVLRGRGADGLPGPEARHSARRDHRRRPRDVAARRMPGGLRLRPGHARERYAVQDHDPREDRCVCGDGPGPKHRKWMQTDSKIQT